MRALRSAPARCRPGPDPVSAAGEGESGRQGALPVPASSPQSSRQGTTRGRRQPSNMVVRRRGRARSAATGPGPECALPALGTGDRRGARPATPPAAAPRAHWRRRPPGHAPRSPIGCAPRGGNARGSGRPVGGALSCPGPGPEGPAEPPGTSRPGPGVWRAASRRWAAPSCFLPLPFLSIN